MTIWTPQQRRDYGEFWRTVHDEDVTPEPGSLNAAVWAAQDRVNAEHAETLARIKALSFKMVDSFYHPLENTWTYEDDQEFMALMKTMTDAHYAAWEQAQREYLAQS